MGDPQEPRVCNAEEWKQGASVSSAPHCLWALGWATYPLWSSAFLFSKGAPPGLPPPPRREGQTEPGSAGQQCCQAPQALTSPSQHSPELGFSPQDLNPARGHSTPCFRVRTPPPSQRPLLCTRGPRPAHTRSTCHRSRGDRKGDQSRELSTENVDAHSPPRSPLSPGLGTA